MFCLEKNFFAKSACDAQYQLVFRTRDAWCAIYPLFFTVVVLLKSSKKGETQDDGPLVLLQLGLQGEALASLGGGLHAHGPTNLKVVGKIPDTSPKKLQDTKNKYLKKIIIPIVGNVNKAANAGIINI